MSHTWAPSLIIGDDGDVERDNEKSDKEKIGDHEKCGYELTILIAAINRIRIYN